MKSLKVCRGKKRLRITAIEQKREKRESPVISNKNTFKQASKYKLWRIQNKRCQDMKVDVIKGTEIEQMNTFTNNKSSTIGASVDGFSLHSQLKRSH